MGPAKPCRNSELDNPTNVQRQLFRQGGAQYRLIKSTIFSKTRSFCGTAAHIADFSASVTKLTDIPVKNRAIHTVLRAIWAGAKEEGDLRAALLVLRAIWAGPTELRGDLQIPEL